MVEQCRYRCWSLTRQAARGGSRLQFESIEVADTHGGFGNLTRSHRPGEVLVSYMYIYYGSTSKI
jgi:hypothetical protein